MINRRLNLASAILFVTSMALPCISAHAAQLKGATTSEPVKPSLSPRFADIPTERVESKGLQQQFEVKRLPPLPGFELKGPNIDRSLQNSALKPARFVVTAQFDGIDASANSGNLAPPDTTGAAGTTQYVQWVNQSLAIFGKDGSIQHSAVDGTALWKGLNKPCAQWNDGDPVVLFDRVKSQGNTDGRWILSQFAVRAGPPYYQCIAVSQTSDARGRYYLYAFKFDLFNDYPKIGVWSNAYYASFNMFKDLGTKDAEGNEQYQYKTPRVCAFERQKMLEGEPARMQCFDSPSRSILPADVDGALAPAPDAAGLFMDYAVNELRLWQMKVDWADARHSTFSGPAEIPVEPFSEPCYSEGCIPQPNTTQTLDATGDRLMFRLAYRRFAGVAPHEALVVNHTVRLDLSGDARPVPSVTASRWYELRRTGAQRWRIQQQGTYAPDIKSASPSSRWAGSIAMDKRGNILLGYTKSSKDIFPSIVATGWSPKTDEPQNLELETELQPGGGSVLPHASQPYRWGDYSTMSLDPDDCTFWYTSEYQPANASYGWKTRVVALRFTDACKEDKPQAAGRLSPSKQRKASAAGGSGQP